MPVHVRISLHAAQTQDVHTFGRDGGRHRATDPVDAQLERKVLVFAELADDGSAMCEGSDERVAHEGREAVQKRDADIVSVHDVMVGTRSVDNRANEALFAARVLPEPALRSRARRTEFSGTSAPQAGRLRPCVPLVSPL